MGSCLSKGGDDDHKKPTKAKTKDPEHEGESKSAQESSKPAERRPIPQGKKINNNELPEDFIIFEPIEDEFDLGEEIGKGGFSVVYKATRKKDGEEFAVKCIKKKLVEGDDIKLLRREIQIMTQLEHPNILKLFQVYEDDEQFYLVMELVKGKELFDKIVERGMYSERDASNIIFQVVSAVDYLHENGIAHRDLKPENLLAAGDGADEIIKIADFGFAKSFSEDGEKLMTSCGSPGYVAPEILTAESYDKSVDMWSVGVIVYILLSGYPPFYADSAPALFKKIMDVKYDFDDTVWDEISDSAKDLIRNLLVKDPTRRFTAKQCLEHPWVKGSSCNDKALLDGQRIKKATGI
ncbi:calcium calmodulin-dependent protein kinase type 1G [Balamuthia mandrillaris]